MHLIHDFVERSGSRANENSSVLRRFEGRHVNVVRLKTEKGFLLEMHLAQIVSIRS